jgi:hypothetical protein
VTDNHESLKGGGGGAWRAPQLDFEPVLDEVVFCGLREDGCFRAALFTCRVLLLPLYVLLKSLSLFAEQDTVIFSVPGGYAIIHAWGADTAHQWRLCVGIMWLVLCVIFNIHQYNCVFCVWSVRRLDNGNNTSSSAQFSVRDSHEKFVDDMWRLNVWIEDFVL